MKAATLQEDAAGTAPAETRAILPGVGFPQGATCDHGGVNFALFAEGATKVELCLFDHADAAHESARIVLRDRTHGI